MSKKISVTEQQHSSIALKETQVKTHPLYKMLVKKSKRFERSKNSLIKSSYKSSLEKPTNYAVFFPTSEYYILGATLNIYKILSTYRKIDVNLEVIAVIYHNKVSSDRLEFETYISYKFSKYCIGNKQYGKSLNSEIIYSVWKEIINGAGFEVTWKSKLNIDKYNNKQ